jgi:uncharacterized protein (TIGR00369 family)
MDVHAEVLQSMAEMKDRFAKTGITLQMPPPSGATLGTRYTEIDPGKMLAAEIRFDLKFTNPMRVFQGGFLCAAFDEVYGPLSYMATGRPVVTIDMSTTYLRLFTEKDEWLTVRAELVAKTKRLLILKAEAHNKKGKLIAISNAHAIIASDENLHTKGDNHG